MKWPAAAMLMLSVVAHDASAAAKLAIERVRYADSALEGVTIEATEGRRIELRIVTATVASLPIAKLRWTCTLELDEAGRRCAGSVRATVDGEARRGRLELALDDAGPRATLSRDKARLTFERAGDATTLAARGVPLDWLAPLVRRVADGVKLGSGTIDAEVNLSRGARLAVPAEPPAFATRLDANWALKDVSFDNADGTIAAAGLHASGTVAGLGAGEGADFPNLQHEATLAAGEVLVSPLYVKLPERPVFLQLETSETPQGWTIPRFAFRDEGVLEASGDLRFDGAARAVSLSMKAVLPAAHERYFQSVLSPLGFGELTTSGKVTARFQQQTGQASLWSAEFDDVAVADAAGRFAVEGLGGEIGIDHQGDRPRTLAWRSAALFGIPVGPAKLRTVAKAGDHFRLVDPLELHMLEGLVRIDRFERTTGIDAALTLDNLSVAALAKRFDWPEFGGTLSGRIPRIRSENDQLVFEGGLDLALFDGRVKIGALAMERPFGVAPSLAADVELQDLDLALLTNTFSFGSIEGRLDGRIADLRLVDWKPVAFDLALITDPKHKGKRRISQKAVNSLSSVGGAGAAAGLQTAVMRVFDTFPYAEIGLRCRLANNVCRMGGIEPIPASTASAGGKRDAPSSAPATYTIVRGSGLPHLTVQGFQRNVDWPVLVDRLKAATSGTAPIVQ